MAAAAAAMWSSVSGGADSRSSSPTFQHSELNDARQAASMQAERQLINSMAERHLRALEAANMAPPTPAEEEQMDMSLRNTNTPIITRL